MVVGVWPKPAFSYYATPQVVERVSSVLQAMQPTGRCRDTVSNHRAYWFGRARDANRQTATSLAHIRDLRSPRGRRCGAQLWHGGISESESSTLRCIEIELVKGARKRN